MKTFQLKRSGRSAPTLRAGIAAVAASALPLPDSFVSEPVTTFYTENELATVVLDCAVELHRSLGPGLLESAYEAAMLHLLNKKGLSAEHQKALPLVYQDVKLEAGYRVDILVEKKLIVEVKSVEAINDVHLAQVMTYLRLSGCRLGLLINFNTVKVMQGVRRVVNKL
ncbi:MAG: GxxExxY protein [Sphingobacteriales bacterium]|nr:GxxExxY protein [Sphingobacteriales bacterium]